MLGILADSFLRATYQDRQHAPKWQPSQTWQRIENAQCKQGYVP